jgi:hypothetical protein
MCLWVFRKPASPIMVRDPIDEDWMDKQNEAEPNPDEFVDEALGPPLSREDIEAAKKALAEWKTPDAFQAEVDALCRRCRPENWVSNDRKFLHEAYVLARFATLRRVDSVRLARRAEPLEREFPDGFVQIAGKKHAIEVTSTHGDRRLGDELRRHVTGPTMDTSENWVARLESIPKYLDEAVLKKKKKYSSCWLVVYLSIGSANIIEKEREATIATIAEVKARYQSSFEAISVLWNGRLY